MATVITEAGTTLALPEPFRSLSEFRDWVHSETCPARGRFEYVGGSFSADLTHERIRAHNMIRSELLTLGRLAEIEDLGRIYTRGVLLINDYADLACEPDFIFCSFDTLRSRRVVCRGWPGNSDGDHELYGVPDMVAEVVSDSSARKDNVEQRQAYFNAGIAEYWLIDGRGDEIEFELLVRGEEGYFEMTPDSEGFRESTVFGQAYRFTREEDPIGGWQPKLLVQRETRS